MNSKKEVEDESKVLTKRKLIERVSVLHNMHLTEEDIRDVFDIEECFQT